MMMMVSRQDPGDWAASFNPSPSHYSLLRRQRADFPLLFLWLLLESSSTLRPGSPVLRYCNGKPNCMMPASKYVMQRTGTVQRRGR